jgi:hypothetical protein
MVIRPALTEIVLVPCAHCTEGENDKSHTSGKTFRISHGRFHKRDGVSEQPEIM